MPNPVVTDVHVNQPLTNISVAYIQSADNFIADKVFPIIPVEKQSDVYYQYAKEDWFRIFAEKRAPGTESAGGGYRVSPAPPYYCDVYAFHKDIDHITRANYDAPLNADTDATKFVTNQALLLRESVFVKNYFKDGVWGSDLTGEAYNESGQSESGFAFWNDPKGDPVKEIKKQIIRVAETTGYKPNTLVVSPYVMLELSEHPLIAERVKYTQTASITNQMLAGLFGVERVLEPFATSVTAPEGDAANYAMMYGKHALLCYTPSSPGLYQPAAGYIFAWKGLAQNPYGVAISKFNLPQIKSERVEIELAFDAKRIGAALGVFFKNAVN